VSVITESYRSRVMIHSMTYRDLKCMTKIVSGLLILRGGSSAEWTSELDSALLSWTKTYIEWLTTAKIAIEEKESTK
jgi:hypothetical protein